MIDREGYRPNVGIVLCNADNQVFWGKRVKQHAWQFPQGGMNAGETPEQARRIVGTDCCGFDLSVARRGISIISKKVSCKHSA